MPGHGEVLDSRAQDGGACWAGGNLMLGREHQLVLAMCGVYFRFQQETIPGTRSRPLEVVFSHGSGLYPSVPQFLGYL